MFPQRAEHFGEIAMPITVQPGDSLWALAQRYGTTVDDLVAANPEIQNPNLIYAGEELNVPGWDGQDAFEPAPEPTPAPQAQAGATYRVQAGDTLSAIAEQYGVSV